MVATGARAAQQMPPHIQRSARDLPSASVRWRLSGCHRSKGCAADSSAHYRPRPAARQKLLPIIVTPRRSMCSVRQTGASRRSRRGTTAWRPLCALRAACTSPLCLLLGGWLRPRIVRRARTRGRAQSSLPPGTLLGQNLGQVRSRLPVCHRQCGSHRARGEPPGI